MNIVKPEFLKLSTKYLKYREFKIQLYNSRSRNTTLTYFRVVFVYRNQ